MEKLQLLEENVQQILADYNGQPRKDIPEEEFDDWHVDTWVKQTNRERERERERERGRERENCLIELKKGET